MGDPNASIPTPQPIHYRPMFGSLRPRADGNLADLRVGRQSIAKGLARKLKVAKRLVAVENTRGKIGKKSLIHNGATPKITVDPGDLCGDRRRRAAGLRAGRQAADGAEVFFVLR